MTASGLLRVEAIQMQVRTKKDDRQPFCDAREEDINGIYAREVIREQRKKPHSRHGYIFFTSRRLIKTKYSEKRMQEILADIILFVYIDFFINLLSFLRSLLYKLRYKLSWLSLRKTQLLKKIIKNTLSLCTF